jgi:hypothetical protein
MPVRLPATIHDPISQMPLDVIRRFRTASWVAAVTMVLMIVSIVLLLAAEVVNRVPVVLPILFTLTALGWMVGVWMLTPALSLPEAALHGFSRRGRLRVAARVLSLAWPMAGALLALRVVAGNLGSAQQGALAGAGMTTAAVGIAGLVVVFVVLWRLARWTRDDLAEKAFNLAAWGLPVVTVGSFLNLRLLLVTLLLIFLALVVILAMPVGLLSLSLSLSYSVVHARDNLDRDERRQDRARRYGDEVLRSVERMDEASSARRQPARPGES